MHLKNLGALKEAHFCRLMHNWYLADDEPGIPVDLTLLIGYLITFRTPWFITYLLGLSFASSSSIATLRAVGMSDGVSTPVPLGSSGVQRHFKQYFSYIVASVLLVEETGIPVENQRPVASH
jgi:hypothetical protein